MEKMIEIRDVTKRSDGKLLFDAVSLDVEKDSITGLVGEEGCGKSMLLKLICGLCAADAGTILVSGRPVSEGQFPESTGVMLDDTELNPYQTGFDAIKRVVGIENRVKYTDIGYMMQLADLNPRNTRQVLTYSEGMKQRLKMAIALVENPALALLDISVPQMDEKRFLRVREMLEIKNKEYGITMLLTSRCAGDLKGLCTHMYRISEHKIVPVAL